MTIRKLNSTDYDEILVKWWQDWGWTPPAKDFLPDNGEGGLIVYDGDIPVCAGYVYVTNSKVSWVEWVISNREYKKKPERAVSLKTLVNSLTEICKSSGSTYVYSILKSPSLIKIYEESGYIKTPSTYITELIKKF